MKELIKKLEKSVLENIVLLENIEFKERHSKYSNDRSKTHISINVDFENKKLSWVSISFQFDIYHQFGINLLKSCSGGFHKSVEFSSNFYDLEEKEQVKRLNIYLKKFALFVKLFSDNTNSARKAELQRKKKRN
jgi:hypothetical protein